MCFSALCDCFRNFFTSPNFTARVFWCSHVRDAGFLTQRLLWGHFRHCEKFQTLCLQMEDVNHDVTPRSDLTLHTANGRPLDATSPSSLDLSSLPTDTLLRVLDVKRTFDSSLDQHKFGSLAASSRQGFHAMTFPLKLNSDMIGN